MSAELPSPLEQSRGLIESVRDVAIDLRTKIGKIASTGLLLLSGGAAAFTVGEAVDPEPAFGSTAQVAVGMPFAGRWAYSNATTAECGSASSQTSHPSCHEIYTGDWSTDLYASAGTDVKLDVDGEDLSFAWDTASGSCGESRRIKIFSDEAYVGRIYITHLNGAASTDTVPSNGMTIGQIANLGCNPGGEGKHVHIEFDNADANTYSCYTNHSTQSHTAGIALNAGTDIGVLGSANTSAKQACDTAPSVATPTPGPTFTPDIIQRPSGETNLAVVGPGNSLVFYYNAPNSATWGEVVVPGGQAYSTPEMVQRPTGETDIAVRGPDNSLYFYFNMPNSSEWGKMMVGAPNSTFSAPAMIQRPNGETIITAQGPGNSLVYYFNELDSPYWASFTVPNAQAGGKPAMALRGSGEIDIVTRAPDGSMNFYYNPPGTQHWGISQVAVADTVHGAPAMIQRPNTGETIIAVEGSNHSLDLYLNQAGSNGWGRLTAAGNGTTYLDGNPPTMALRPGGELDIAVRGQGDQARFYYSIPGTPNFGDVPVATPGNNFRAPVMVQRPNTGETDLIAVGPQNRLDLYINAAGFPNWGKVAVDGAHSAS